MTAIPSTPLPATDWSQWISCDDAARLLECNRDHLTRTCRADLQRQGMAMYGASPAGGNPRWWIARSYDLRLAPGSVGAAFQAPDLSGYTEAQRAGALARAACVEVYKEARSSWSGKQSTWLPRLIDQLRLAHPKFHGRISRSTLHQWYAVYRCPADLPKLIDGRGGNTRGHADPAAWSIFRGLFLDERQPTIRSCWERTKEECQAKQIQWTTYRACVRGLDDHIPPELQAKARTPRIYRQKFAPYVPQLPGAWEAGQCWIGDHSPLDLWCQFRGQIIRPAITAWIDWRSRRLVGHTLSASPDTNTILSSFRAGMLDEANMGGPAVVWIDNGKDFDAWSLQGQTKQQRLRKMQISVDETSCGKDGLFGLLSIEVHWSLAHNPNGKSRMERWFGTLHGDFDKSWPTYCGADQDAKPEDLNALLREKPQLIPGFDQVAARLGDWIKGYNTSPERSIEDIDGLSSDEYLAQHCPVQRALANPAVLDLLRQVWHKPVRVGRNGVTIHPKGRPLSYGQYEPALTRLKGTKEQVRVSYDAMDLRQVRVYDMQWRLICTADLVEMGGYHGNDPLKIDHLREVIAQQRREVKAKATLRDASYSQYLTAAERLVEEAAKDRRPASPCPEVAGSEPRLCIVQTPLDGAPKELERQQLRKAAGAEHLTDLDPLDLGGGSLDDLAMLAQARGDALDLDPIDFSSASAADDSSDTDVTTGKLLEDLQ